MHFAHQIGFLIISNEDEIKMGVITRAVCVLLLRLHVWYNKHIMLQ